MLSGLNAEGWGYWRSDDEAITAVSVTDYSMKRITNAAWSIVVCIIKWSVFIERVVLTHLPSFQTSLSSFKAPIKVRWIS